MSISLLTANTTSSISVAAGVTHYQKTGNYVLQTQTAETDAQVVFTQVATSLSKMYVRVNTNSATSGSGTIRLRINAANGNENISIPFATTGDFQDAINTDTYSAGDKLNYIVTGATGGSIAYTNLSILFNGGASVCLHKALTSNHTSSTDSLQEFFPICGNAVNLNTIASTDVQVQVKFKTAATLKNMSLYCNSNTSLASTVYNSRKNAVTGNCSITIPTITTGFFADTVNTDTISVNDLVNGMITTGLASGSVAVRHIGFEVITTNDKNHFIAAIGAPAGSSFTQGATSYIGIDGQSTGNSTEINGTKCNVSFSATFLSCYVISNTITAQSTLAIRKNSVTNVLSLNIPASTTGFFEDTTNLVFCYATDIVNYMMVAGSGGVSLALGMVSVLADYAAIAPVTVDALFFAGD